MYVTGKETLLTHMSMHVLVSFVYQSALTCFELGAQQVEGFLTGQNEVTNLLCLR